MTQRPQKLSRRGAIKLGAQSAVAATAATACKTPGNSSALSESKVETAHCLVLGAGVAGLTAASMLESHWQGRGKVVVLEGSGRAGGRIWTLRNTFAGPVELGAEFIHRDSLDVTLWDAVQFFDLPTVKLPKMGEGLVYYPPRFKEAKRTTYAAMAWNIFKAMTMFPAIDLYRGPDLTAGQWLEKRRYQDLGRDFVAMALTGHMPGTLDDLSIRGFASDKLSHQLNERHEHYITTGYGSLIDALKAPLDVRYNQTVNRIAYSPAGVSVTTADGKTYQAPKAIVTFSVGMLKSGEVEFYPPLPRQKQEALSYLEAGHHSKYIMQFRERFWPEDMFMGHYPWHERQAGKTYFHVFYDQPQKPPVLKALSFACTKQSAAGVSDR